MKPSIHAAVSAGLALTVWSQTHSAAAAAICLATGTVIDVDHVLDYYVTHRFRRFSVKNLHTAYEHCNNGTGELFLDRLVLLFHSTEAALIGTVLAVLSAHLILAAGALGYSVHILLDYIHASRAVNPRRRGECWKIYFFLWRMMRGFKTDAFYLRV